MLHANKMLAQMAGEMAMKLFLAGKEKCWMLENRFLNDQHAQARTPKPRRFDD